MSDLPIEQRRQIARGLAVIRARIRENYRTGGTARELREDRDALRATLRALRWVRAYTDGDLKDE